MDVDVDVDVAMMVIIFSLLLLLMLILKLLFRSFQVLSRLIELWMLWKMMEINSLFGIFCRHASRRETRERLSLGRIAFVLDRTHLQE